MNSRSVSGVELAGRSLIRAIMNEPDMPAEEHAELNRIIETLGSLADRYWSDAGF